MGKFIYLMDAYEDLPNDLEKGCYNPLKKIAEEEGYEERIKQILCMMIAESTAEFEKLPCLSDIDILRNILYDGVWNCYNKIQRKKSEEQKKMINNPYEVLGVSPSASDDEIKKHIVILQESIIRMRMLIILLQILQKKSLKKYRKLMI